MIKLKYFVNIIFLMTLSFNYLHAANGDGSLSDSNIQYIGRWDKSNKEIYHSYWGGAYIRVCFTGTTIKMKLAGKANIYVNIDGQGDVKYSKANGIINLTPEPLVFGTHTLLVAANYSNDEIKFQGFMLDKNGTTLAFPKKKLIEFIGNSITTGEKTVKRDLSAFAWLTAEKINADHTQISQPGITLVDGYHYNGDWAPKRGQEIQYFLTKQPNHKQNFCWDFTRYTPEIIVINLGTNDFKLKVPKKEFYKSYLLFLKNIRAKYPKAEIFAMRTFGGYYKEETQKAVKKRLRKKDDKVHYIDTAGWLELPTDFFDGIHPTDEAHVKIANKLEPVLRKFISTRIDKTN